MVRQILFLGLLFISILKPTNGYCQSDSLWVNKISQLIEIDTSIRVLILDVELPTGFDYEILPKKITEIIYLKPIEKVEQPGGLTDFIPNLKKIELNGDMISLLPEILDFSENLESVTLTNGALFMIWSDIGTDTIHHLKELHLKDFKIKDDCRMYENLFWSEKITADKIYFTGRKPSANNLALLMDLFETHEVFVNGLRQKVYLD